MTGHKGINPLGRSGALALDVTHEARIIRWKSETELPSYCPMAFPASSSSTSPSLTCYYLSSHFLSGPRISTHPFRPSSSILNLTPTRRPNLSQSLIAAAAKSAGNAVPSKNPKENKKEVVGKDTKEDEVEVEEELPWIQEKALDLVEFTGSVTQAIPGPRVGTSSLPWILAVPLAYAGITFVISFVKTVKKFTSPRHKRKKLVNKNAMLCKSINELFQTGNDAVNQSALKGLTQKTGFSTEEILRKYIRYSLNEKPWTADLVASLIQLRKASTLDDSQVAEILNEISRRIVREKGPVVMDMSGFTEKGFKRKLAVQGLFGKVLYLSELPEFCSRDSSLIVKEIFGVTDEDADKLRLHTFSEAGDVGSLEKMVDDSDSDDSSEDSSVAA